jgi:tetratricopeptide (TPR) repeat protein
MKKIFFTLLFISLSWLNASAFNHAKSLYTSGYYQLSYDAFFTLFTQDSANQEINFYLALSAIELQKYDSALAALERVLLIDPEHTRSQLELGRIYFELGDALQAKKAFSKVLASDIPNDVRENILRYIGQMQNISSNSKLEMQLALGILHDTNINNGNSFLHPLTNEMVNPKNADSGGIISGGLNYLYDIGEKSGVVLSSSENFYYQNFSKESDFDLLFNHLESGVMFQGKQYQLQSHLFVESLVLGDTTYLNQYGLLVDVQTQIAPDLMAMLKSRLYEKAHSKANQVRDADGYRVDIGVQYAINSYVDTIGIMIGSMNEQRQQSIRNDVSFSAQDIQLWMSKSIGNWGNIDFVAQLSQSKYDHKIINANGSNEIRKDNGRYLALTYSYPFSKTDLISTTISTIDNRSTHKFFAYQKESMSLMYSKRF